MMKGRSRAPARMETALQIERKSDDRSSRYKDAYKLFMESEGAPDLLKIAERTGCHPSTLVTYAENKKWTLHRATLDSQRATLATNNRGIEAAKIDAAAVVGYSRFFGKLTARLHELADVICDLPINDPDSRVRAQQVAKGLELTNETIKGLAGLVETGRAIGLILGAKTLPGSDAGKLDFAKLTTLNLTLIQAQKEAGVKPVEVMELDAAPEAPPVR